MKHDYTYKRESRPLTVFSSLIVLSLCASCGVLPSVGPNKHQIYAGSEQRQGDAFVVAVDDRVARASEVQYALDLPAAFRSAGPIEPDTIRAGDTLGITVWENVDNGVMNSGSLRQTPLQETQVDGAGYIFVPYAGRIRAEGNTPEALRRILTAKLEDQTPNPQIEVRRLAGKGSTVSVAGSVSGQGVYPIELPTRRLSGMIAAAGGLAIKPEVARVTVIRGGQRVQMRFEDLYSRADTDIALRSGDRILVEEDKRAFTVLGATGAQALVPFESASLNVIEALTRAGGLSTRTSDPSGVFVLRDETAEISGRVLGRSDLQGTQPMIYVLDLVEPNGLFMARKFSIRDGDTIYVTEAPFTQWSKVISALTGTLGAANTISSASGSL